jgi:drug/metabolite transporter (DMT)-like permease
MQVTWLFPGLFVVLWSTGFIGAKLGLPYAEPFTFLSLRFLFVLAILLPICWFLRAPWPNRQGAGHMAIAGVLMQGGYLGGVFASMHQGMPAGVSALITGLQPVFTAVLGSWLLHERTTPRQWLGRALGLAGVALVVGDRMLFYLIRHGAATRVASLFYLVPPTTALIAWPLFAESYSLTAAAGMGLGMLAVWLVTKP